MNALARRCLFIRWLTVAALVFATGVGQCATLGSATTMPTVLKVAVMGKSLMVTVSVPKGWQSVTLESREPSGQGAWVPRAVTRARQLPSRVTFRVSTTFKGQNFRVRGEAVSAQPLTFFNGRHTFASRRSVLWRAELGAGVAYALAADGKLMAGATVPTTGTVSQRTVEESDIWKISGDTLYFFNQYRGLQVVDIADPDAPRVRGTLELPAAGDQLYVLGANTVALLARRAGEIGQSQVLVVDVSGAAPKVIANIPLEGLVTESRLVGSVLYVAAQACLEVAAAKGTTWQWGTAVYALDLVAPSAPVARSTLWFAGQGNAVLATERYLFVATQDVAEGSVVRVIDIGDPSGAMSELAALVTAGRVGDKFKMNLNGEIFTAVSERFDASASESGTVGGWLSVFETFSLADASHPVSLGRLALAPGERLFATRFDGTRAYAVTFRQIDPLWIVDLADPSHPAVVGEVEVPGWSTYIRPLGDRLVTVGVEAGRVAVSLFAVGDPAKAGLLARVRLGDGWSWSEANANEKALSLFEAEGLLLLPFEGYTTNGYRSQVQLIDVTDSSLAARGVIDQRFQARRTALHRGRVLSLSGKTLLTVNVTDRDNPVVTATTELSWAVNRVQTQGDYLLELETPGVWSGAGSAAVRVVAKAQHNVLLNRLELGAWPVVGQCVRDGRLYVLQRPAGGYGGGYVIALDANAGMAAAVTNLLLTVIDLSALPALEIVGKAAVADSVYESQYEAVWPKPDLLVWVSKASNDDIYRMFDVALPLVGNPVIAAGGLAAARDMMGAIPWWPWWSETGVQLLAFDVRAAAAPAFVSSHRYRPPSARGFSVPLVAQGLVYFSHEQSEKVNVYSSNRRFIFTYNSQWRVREVLDVIDYANPAAPTERQVVEVPGQLVGLSPDGRLLYCHGLALNAADDATVAAEAVHACSYDGVSAYLVASLPLPREWPRPVRVAGDSVYVGRPSASAGAASHLEGWRLSAEGMFVCQAVATLASPASALASFGSLLAAQCDNGAVELFDASVPTTLRLCGSGAASGGAWFDLSRAVGALAEGLWIPLDDFGLAYILGE
ncbi:MAG: beta-propeller domain-containing protein [bacterium]